MKITQDAVTSAQTGRPTYEVHEEDRNVVWTLDRQALDDMLAWDSLSREERMERIVFVLGLINSGQEIGDDLSPSYQTCWKYRGSDGLDQHAKVARNALRGYLGMPTSGTPLPA